MEPATQPSAQSATEPIAEPATQPSAEPATESATEPATEQIAATLPIGRSGRLEAYPLAVAGDHAVLVRETGTMHRHRALLTTDKLAAGERLVVMPLDQDVEVRVDGDALAVWIGAGATVELPPSQRPVEATHVPLWASLIGGALLLLLLVLAVIGSAVAFSWLVRLLT